MSAAITAATSGSGPPENRHRLHRRKCRSHNRQPSAPAAAVFLTVLPAPGHPSTPGDARQGRKLRPTSFRTRARSGPAARAGRDRPPTLIAPMRRLPPAGTVNDTIKDPERSSKKDASASRAEPVAFKLPLAQLGQRVQNERNNARICSRATGSLMVRPSIPFKPEPVDTPGVAPVLRSTTSARYAPSGRVRCCDLPGQEL